MLPGMKFDPEIAKSSHETRRVFGQGRISTPHHTVGSVWENIPFPCSEEAFQVQHENKSRHSLGQPYLSPNRELRHRPPKSSESAQKSRVECNSSDGDELVKHMSNLPDFLQQVEKEKSIQARALNFGVLDWKRLEKWKYTERMPGRSPKKTSSASVTPKMSPTLKKQPYSHSSQFNSPQWQSPLPQSSHFKDVRYPSYHKEEKYVGLIKSEGTGTCDENLQAAQVSTRQEDHFRQRVQLCQRSCSNTNTDNRKRKESSKHKSSLLPAINALAKTSRMGSDDETKFSTECCLAEPRSNMILPKHMLKNRFSGSSQFMESRASQDGQLLGAVGNTLSNLFSADVPHPSPRLSAATYKQVTSHAINLNIRRSANSATTSEGKYSKIPDETTTNERRANITEHPVVRGRTPSPTRRFSFSLGKLSRNGSFKEGSAVPQLSSPKPELSADVDNIERDKESVNSRKQSSPLRRLLNPLLKYKGPQSSETARPSTGNLHTMTVRTTGTKGPSQSCVQALLQLTLKNELPFFKLVVDNNEDMLAAALKVLPMSGKTDPCLIYTFYSVHEIRKKGMNWISQASKSKSCSLGYKIVGQMKISNYHSSRECVLYGVEPNKEIAAVIVKNLIKFPEEENKTPTSMVVVLPGGVHSVPIKGTPSSLISRWRSGGVCDCGGWDVGCKLRILADLGKSRSIPHTSGSISDFNCVNLFVQGDELKSKPVFSLEPLSNGLCSVKLDASISLLEAFAACVAYVTCSKFPEMIDLTDKMKTPIMFQDQRPGQYVTCPPLSPAGRI